MSCGTKTGPGDEEIVLCSNCMGLYTQQKHAERTRRPDAIGKGLAGGFIGGTLLASSGCGQSFDFAFGTLVCGQAGAVCESCKRGMSGQARVVPCSPEELPQFLAAEQAQGQAKHFTGQNSVQRDKTPAEVRLVVLAGQRKTLIAYLLDKVADADWHGTCDAANDLRELDCEARTLEGK